MAVINLSDLYTSKLRKLSYDDSALLQASYVDAVNMVFSELNSQVFQSQTIDYITAYDDVTTLDDQYYAPMSAGVDYHLQEGGMWAMEPEVTRERNWYLRGIPQARNTLQNNTTYSNPLGI